MFNLIVKILNAIKTIYTVFTLVQTCISIIEIETSLPSKNDGDIDLLMIGKLNNTVTNDAAE